MFAKTHACTIVGTFAEPVRVEVDVERGLPRITLLGLPSAESGAMRERVRCALAAAGIELPLSRVTINLAPADMPKRGAGLDLAVAIAIATAAGHIKPDEVRHVSLHAELGLDGTLRPARGTLAALHRASRDNRSWLVTACEVPRMFADDEGATQVARFADLGSVVGWLATGNPEPIAPTVQSSSQEWGHAAHSIADIRGSEVGVRAATVAAAGGHNMLLVGPPGCGKTLLCSALHELVPPLGREEQLEVATIYDAAGAPAPSLGCSPIRAPHHGITTAGLIGGGSGALSVGEITLAHRGLLFLDELPEFRPAALESLREPLEQGRIRIRRTTWNVELPARFQLIAAMNLCRCGRFGQRSGPACSCSDIERSRYVNRVSGAIRSRFDLLVPMHPPRDGVFVGKRHNPEVLRDAVRSAVLAQEARWGGGGRNAHVRSVHQDGLNLQPEASALLQQVGESRVLSGRAQLALVRVARTVADLDGAEDIAASHVGTALQLCPDDRVIDHA